MKIVKKVFRVIKKTFKWLGISILSILILLTLAGLTYLLVTPKAQEPDGKLVDIGGFKLHVKASGEKNDLPTLIIESGAGGVTEHYHWLSEGLKDHMRVIRYDRAGVGHSEASDMPRDPDTIAKELHDLLEQLGESPPYMLAGHSLGGPYMRAFVDLYREEVAGLFLLDATHPNQVEISGAPKEFSFEFKLVLGVTKLQGVACDLGIVSLYDATLGPLIAGEGLPEEINDRISGYLRDGKLARGYAKELEEYHATLRRIGEPQDFDSLPVRVFTAVAIDREAYKKAGIDPDEHLKKTIESQKDYTQLSSDAQQFLINGSHQTIFTKKENADIICREVLKLLPKPKKK